ncbi:MAG: hypothetical protein P1S46_11075 [bacterium]|nr:hypothetical protein [bacterium]
MQLIIRAAGWFLIMTIYWAVGWLNVIQALKTGFLGALTILTLTAWTVRDGTESRFGRLLNGLTAFLFLGISGYHAFLRDVFGVAQDDMIVVEALFNTNGGEASEFISQNIFYLGKHVFVLVVAVSLYWLLLGWRPPIFRFKKAGGPVVAGRHSLAGRAGAIFLTVLLAVVHLNPTMRKENPLLYFPIRKAKWERSVENTRVMQEKIVAAISTDSSLATMTYTWEGARTVVFVLGESVTRHNWLSSDIPV